MYFSPQNDISIINVKGRVRYDASLNFQLGNLIKFVNKFYLRVFLSPFKIVRTLSSAKTKGRIGLRQDVIAVCDETSTVC